MSRQEYIKELCTFIIVGFTTEILNTSLITVTLISGVILITVLIGLIICVIKRKCVSTKTSKKDLQSQEPTYEEVSDTHLK